MTALAVPGNAVVLNATTHGWFVPLLTVILISTGWKTIGQFGLYVARFFGHGTSGS